VVNEHHPLSATLNKIRHKGSTIQHISLSYLDLPAITQLIADTLNEQPPDIEALAKVVREKTNGNPFFVREFLRTLHSKKLIAFDYQRGAWQWEWRQIQGQSITDNLVTMMVERVTNLPQKSQEMLKIAACIGNSFDLATIAIVSNRSPQEVSADLWPALTESLLLPLSKSERLESKSDDVGEEESLLDDVLLFGAKFAHNQVRQAVYSLIPEAEKQGYHWHIGQQLLQVESGIPEHTKRIFKVVHHLNQGRALITQQAKRDELAKLNLLACQRAKESVAYDSAFGYGQCGIALLADHCWQSSYQLALSLYTEVAESAYLSGQFQLSTALIRIVLKNKVGIFDKIRVYEIKISAFLAKNKLGKSIQIGLEALALLGVTFPKLSNEGKDALPYEREISLRSERTKAALAGKTIEALIELPEMTSPLKLAAMRILNRVFAPAYLAMPRLMQLIVLEMVNLSLAEGNAPQSAFAYANYGLILCGHKGDIENGSRFGQLALNLLQRSKSKTNQVRTSVNVNFFVKPWHEHIRETLEPFLSAYQLGLETGDLTFATYALHDYYLHSYFSGNNLAQVKKEMSTYEESLKQLKQERILLMNKLYRQVITTLIEGGTTELAGPLYDKAQELPKHEQANDKTSLCILHFNQMILCYLFQEYAQAVRYAEIAQTHLTALTGSVLIAIFYFYNSLALLALYPNGATTEQAQLLAKVSANQEKMKYWAHHAPMNYQHKFYLVQAEYCRVLGHHKEARDYYEQAIQLAQQHGYTQEEALARELTGKFYLSTKRHELASFYLQKAHQSYQRWGALAKVKALEEQYPLFFAHIQSSSSKTSSLEPLVGSQMSSMIDLKSVLRASSAILGEIVLEKLLSTLMTIVIENAGARRGYLILAAEKDARHQKWVIAATGMVKADGAIMTELPSQPLNKSHDFSNGIVYYVARTKEPVVLHDAAHDSHASAPNAYDSYISQKQPKSILCMPLINQGKLNGILYLENNLITGAFTPDRLQILNLLCSQAAISLENALLYNTLEEKVAERTEQLAQANQEITLLNEMLQEENLRMGAELDVTRRLQKMMLPTPEELAQIEGLDIAIYIEPADEVGGDYLDVLQHNGHVKIGIGDVTGHGLESGIVMLQTQMGVRTLLNSEERDAKRFLAVLNRSIYDNVQRVNPYRNLTLSLLDYTRTDIGGSLKVSGQHEEVIVVRRNGQIELVDTIDLGLPLGLDEEIEEFVDSLIIELEPRDAVVLYTDGITEAKNSKGSQYGQERLCEVVSQHWNAEAQSIQQAVIEDLYRHIGTQKIADDITLLVAKQK
jgi:predicted ATPase/serine phosphatase RsbU (regulator of sigma subunit)